MKHHKKERKFGREKGVRSALFVSLAISLVKYGKIETTEAKAKELRKFIEPLITKAKKGGVETRRLIASRLQNNRLETKKIVDELAPKYKEVAGGYTRIIKIKDRLGDGAKKAIIEFV